MEKELIDLKIDKRMFSVVSLSDQSDDKDYWLAKTPADRLRHIEILRRINYGISATSRLQRILEYVENLKQLKINKQASGRHKDLDDIENLP